MKILMAPVNIAGQPIALVKELQRQGVDVSLFQYSLGASHRFGYRSGKIFDLRGQHRRIAELEVFKEALLQDFDIYHFWMTTFFSAPKYESFYGLDLPFIKARGKKIVYRSTGYDIRTREIDLKGNPYSPFRYGFKLEIDEERQRRYLAYLKDYVDVFICQDPEMEQFMPGAQIIPRSIDLEGWPFVGVKKTDVPIIVHAPSKMAVKGTRFIEKAIDELAAEGLKFEFKLIHGLKQEEAIKLYKAADICIDQILIGWYGVFSIESMALGKPVIAYVREDLADRIDESIPIVNANPDNIKSKIKDLILDFERRKALGELGRKYVETVHDVRGIAKKTKDLYENLIDQPCKRPTACHDLEYFTLHFNDDIEHNKAFKSKRIRLERKIQHLQLASKKTPHPNKKQPFRYRLLVALEKMVKSLSYRGLFRGTIHIIAEISRDVFGEKRRQ